MSSPAEADKVDDLEFKWGKKRGVGGKKKEVQFYDSFIYDGLEYVLHDCVYLYKEGEPEPYIGKIIKIWQNTDKSKKVKILWFFRPREILTWFNDEETHDNELFLACGEGVGLANVNPLEAIAGKCNVVCISKDNRNPQPSEEELHMAEFVFYRTFDVGRHTVSDKIDDKIAGIDVKFMFNRIESQKPNGFPNLDSDRRENPGNFVPNNETPMTSRKLGTGIEDKVTLKSKNDADKGEGNSGKIISNQVEDGEKVKAIKAFGDLDTNNETPMTSGKRGTGIEDKVTGKSKNDADKGEGISGKIISNLVEDGEKVKAIKASGDLDTRPFKKAKVESSIKFSGDKNMNVIQNSSIDKTTMKQENALEDNTTPKSKIDFDKSECNVGKVLVNQGQVGEKGRALKVSADLDSRSFKKAKVDCTFKSSEDKNRNVIQDSSIDSDGVNVKTEPIISESEDRTKSKLAEDSRGLDNNLFKKLKSDEKMAELSNGKLLIAANTRSPEKDKKVKLKSDEKMPELSNGKFLKGSNMRSPEKDNKVGTQVMEVTRRPDADRSRWFKGLPWEERMQNAYKQETLVLLENLDPAYTSAELEDIVWHGFKEICTAKMIQSTGFSSPHSGQAFVIFKNREAAEKVVNKLQKECLMLSGGRPLVGSFGIPCFPKKESTLIGHLAIDRPKIQMQREMKGAVSTSHCSQPNTIEYDMSLEWCLHQDRSESSLKKLYKRQWDEIRKVKAELKFK